MQAIIRQQQFVSLKRFSPKCAGVSLRWNQTAPYYDAQEGENSAELISQTSNSRSVENPTTQPLVNKRWDLLLQPKVKALLVDAAGTLLSPSEPTAEVSSEKDNFIFSPSDLQVAAKNMPNLPQLHPYNYHFLFSNILILPPCRSIYDMVKSTGLH